MNFCNVEIRFPYKENNPNQFRFIDESSDEIQRKIKELGILLNELKYEQGTEYDKADIYSLMGIAYSKLGYYETSKKKHENHLTIAQELGDRKSQGRAYTNLGCVHRITGNLQEAFVYFEKALGLARDRSDKKAIAKNLNNLGNIYELKLALRDAIDCHEERREISREIEDLDGMCKACACLGGLYRTIGDLERSIERYEELVESLRTKLRIQVVIADDDSDSDDDVDVDEIAYEIQRERMEALKRYETKTTKKTRLAEKLQKCRGNVGFFFKSLMKR